MPDTPVPPTSILLNAARRIVYDAKRKNGLDILTVNTVRKQVERDFSLKEGTLEREDLKLQIREAVTAAVAEDWSGESDGTGKLPTNGYEIGPPPPKSARKVPINKEQEVKEVMVAKKRKSRKNLIIETDSETEGIESSVIHAKRQPFHPKTKKRKDSEDEDEESEATLADELPRKKRAKSTQFPDSKSSASGDVKKKSSTRQTPEEQVKWLKSLVNACGSRPHWSKVFSDLPQLKQQLKRLTKMLDNLGMSKPYSLTKAKDIKRARAISRELKDVQEFEKKAGLSRAHRKAGAELDTDSQSESEDEDPEPSESEESEKPASKLVKEYMAKQQSEEEE